MGEKIGRFGFERELYQCFFWGVSHLADALGRTRNSSAGTDWQNRCSMLAQHAVGPGSRSMMQMRVDWFIAKPGLYAYVQKPHVLTHVETLDKDVHHVLEWLGCRDVNYIAHTHAQYKGKDDVHGMHTITWERTMLMSAIRVCFSCDRRSMLNT